MRVAWDLRPGEVPASELLARPVPGLRQEGPDLGTRLYRALASLRDSHRTVAAVGSDHPTLSAARVKEAFAVTEGAADVVIGPAKDGGYYLIAVDSQRLHPRLFEEIDWSTERVLEQTLERCRELDLRYALLAPESDVDRPEDLEWLKDALAGLPEERCPRTRRVLADRAEEVP